MSYLLTIIGREKKGSLDKVLFQEEKDTLEVSFQTLENLIPHIYPFKNIREILILKVK